MAMEEGEERTHTEPGQQVRRKVCERWPNSALPSFTHAARAQGRGFKDGEKDRDFGGAFEALEAGGASGAARGCALLL